MKRIIFLILIFTCNVVVAQSEQPRTIVFKLLGTIIVASAGNYLCDNKPNTPIYPFSPLIDDRIICVTNTDYQDRHQYFNSDGSEKTHAHYPSVTICAPGYN